MAGPQTYGEGSVLRTPSLIAKEGLFRLSEKLIFPRFFTKKWQKYFSDKIGDTVWLKLPYHASITKGRKLGTALPKVDRVVQFVVDQRYHIDFDNYDEELTLGLDDFMERYFKTGLEELAIEYDYQGADAIGLETYFVNGEPGTAMTTDAIQTVREHFDDVGIPDSENFAILNPADFTAISQNVRSLQHEGLVSQAVRTRFMGMAGTFETYQSTHLARMIVADNGNSTPLVDFAGGYVGDMLPSDGWANSQLVLREGQLITVGTGANSIREIQPRGTGARKRPTGRAQVFTVKADVMSDGSGQATIPISPEINDGTMTFADKDGNAVAATAFKNVSQKAADNAPIALVGGAATEGKEYRQGVFFHGDAATYANIQLTAPESFPLKAHATDPETALAISILGAPDVVNASERLRADIFFNCRAIDPRLGQRFPTTQVL